MRPHQTFVTVVAGLACVTAMGCDISPTPTGNCQPATPIAVNTSFIGEAFHDDCRGPDFRGDILTLTLATQSSVRFGMDPSNFTPTFALYRGSPDDENPEQVFWMVAAGNNTIFARADLVAGDYFIVAGSRNAVRGEYYFEAPSSSLNDCVRDNWTMKGIIRTDSLTLADCNRTTGYTEQVHTIWLAGGDSLTVEVAASDSVQFLLSEACCSYTTRRFLQLGTNDTLKTGYRNTDGRRPYFLTLRRDVELKGPIAYRLDIH